MDPKLHAPVKAYRGYASTPRFIEYLPEAASNSNVKELHIVLAFARDYNAQGKNMNGVFKPYFDTGNFNVEKINKIKKSAGTGTRVKFFLSIGGRDPRFPFAVTPSQKETWKLNATSSLQGLLMSYGGAIDGIDVCYEHIHSGDDDLFATSIHDLVEELKRQDVIKEASITVPDPKTTPYKALFDKKPGVFEHVVSQTHTMATLFPYPALRSETPFPKEKTFAGHSIQPTDSVYIPLPTFLDAVPLFLAAGFAGISMWTVDPYYYDPEK